VRDWISGGTRSTFRQVAYLATFASQFVVNANGSWRSSMLVSRRNRWPSAATSYGTGRTCNPAKSVSAALKRAKGGGCYDRGAGADARCHQVSTLGQGSTVLCRHPSSAGLGTNFLSAGLDAAAPTSGKPTTSRIESPSMPTEDPRRSTWVFSQRVSKPETQFSLRAGAGTAFLSQQRARVPWTPGLTQVNATQSPSLAQAS
jgi:hypothetical protein